MAGGIHPPGRAGAAQRSPTAAQAVSSRAPAAGRPRGGTALLGDLLDDAERRIRGSRQADLWKPWVARADAEEIAELVLGREIGDEDLDLPVEPSTRHRLETMFQRRVDG